MVAVPHRARSGPQKRKDDRVKEQNSDGISVVFIFLAVRRKVEPSRVISTPRSSAIASMFETSRMFGALRSTSVSSVRRDAAIIGSTAFLFPATFTRPEIGAPPVILKRAITPLPQIHHPAMETFSHPKRQSRHRFFGGLDKPRHGIARGVFRQG
jgi:hypothetical protein